MFKNLDGFKKIKEDENSVHMQHPKGHVIIVATKALPALQRKQLHSLPLHECSGGSIKMAKGGGVMKYADGSADAGNDQPIPGVDTNTAPQQNMTAVPDAIDISDEQKKWPPNVEDDSLEGELQSANGNKSYPPQYSSEAGQNQSPPASNADQPPQDINSISAQSISDLGVRGLQKQMSGQLQQAAGEKQAGLGYQKNLEDAAARWDKTKNDYINHVNTALEDAAKEHINPKHYMAGQGAATAIGLFLGGLSTPFTHQGNPALEMINKQIDRDIDAQKAGLNNKVNIYHAYLDQFKNAAVAESMTRATEYGLYAQKIRQAAADSADPLIRARELFGEQTLQNQILPQVVNSHLMGEASKFSGANPQAGGSEAEYQTFLSNAQRMNPELYKDQQAKYIPGVGTAAIPVEKEDVTALSTYKNLNELAKQAQDFAQTTGRTVPGTNANQRANDIANNMRLQIGQLVNLKRINDYEAKKYDDMVRSPGGWNQGAAVQSFKDLRSDIAGKTQAIGDKYKIKPFRR